jgi:hypothetical protein
MSAEAQVSLDPSARLGYDVVNSLTDPQLFGPFFRPIESWQRWLTVLRCLFGLPLSLEERPLFTQCTGRTAVFPGPLTEAWRCVGAARASRGSSR